MITRIWHGWTTKARADDYQALLAVHAAARAGSGGSSELEPPAQVQAVRPLTPIMHIM